MDTIKRALIYLKRFKVRNFIFFLIELMCMFLVVVSVTISRSSATVSEEIKSTVFPYFGVKMFDSFDDREGSYPPSADVLDTIERIKNEAEILDVYYVKEYDNVTLSLDLYNALFNAQEDRYEPYQLINTDKNGFIVFDDIDNLYIHEYFELIEGEGFEESDFTSGNKEIIVSEGVFDMNKDPIKVGDQVKFNYLFDNGESLEFTFTVKGFADGFGKWWTPEEAEYDRGDFAVIDAFDFMITNKDWEDMLETIKTTAIEYGIDLKEDPTEYNITEVYFKLADVDDFDVVSGAFNDPTYENTDVYFVKNQDDYSMLKGPLENIHSMSTLLFAISSLGAILILAFMSWIHINHRMNDYKILLKMGETKRKIVSEYLLEIGFVTFIAILVVMLVKNKVSDFIYTQIISSDVLANYTYSSLSFDAVLFLAIFLITMVVSAGILNIALKKNT